MRVDDDFRIQINIGQYELLNDIEVVQRINIQPLRWLDHVARMEEDASAGWVFNAKTCGSQRKG